MCYFTMIKDIALSRAWSGAMHLLPEYNDLNLAYLATERLDCPDMSLGDIRVSLQMNSYIGWSSLFLVETKNQIREKCSKRENFSFLLPDCRFKHHRQRHGSIDPKERVSERFWGVHLPGWKLHWSLSSFCLAHRGRRCVILSFRPLQNERETKTGTLSRS